MVGWVVAAVCILLSIWIGLQAIKELKSKKFLIGCVYLVCAFGWLKWPAMLRDMGILG